jgi:hypothetical protein
MPKFVQLTMNGCRRLIHKLRLYAERTDAYNESLGNPKPFICFQERRFVIS